jgi:integrase
VAEDWALLHEERRTTIQAALVPKSQSNYKWAQGLFATFCCTFLLRFPPAPALLSRILPNFFTWLAKTKNYGQSTIHSCFYAAQDLYLSLGLPFPTHDEVVHFSFIRMKNFCKARTPTLHAKPCSLATATTVLESIDNSLTPLEDLPALAFILMWVSAVRPDSILCLRLRDISFSFSTKTISILWSVKHWKPVLVKRVYDFAPPLYPLFMERLFSLVAARSAKASQEAPLFASASNASLNLWVVSFLGQAGMNLDAVPSEALNKASCYSLRRGRAQLTHDSHIGSIKEKKAAVSILLIHKSEKSGLPYLARGQLASKGTRR